MEIKGSRGYVLPDVIDPQAYRCFSLYFPDDDAYLHALSGHLHQLATWQVWEKDGTTRASQAAKVWKDAIDLSIEELWLKGLVMTCDNVQDLINAISQITTNVNVECSCGGGCGNTQNTWRMPEGWEDTWNDAPIPDSTTPTSEPETYLCDAAHAAHAELKNWFVNFADSIGNESPYTDAVNDITGSGLANPYAAWLWNVFTFVTNLFYDGFTNEVQLFWESMKDVWICAVVNNTNGLDLKTVIIQYIRDNAPTWSVGYYMETMLTGSTFNTLYDGTYTYDPIYNNSTCDCSDILPSLPAGWYYAPVLDVRVLDFNALSNPDLITSGNGAEFTSVCTSNTLDSDKVSIDRDNVLIDAGGVPADIRRGMIARYTACTRPETSDNTNADACIDGANVSGSRLGWTNTTRYQFRYRSGGVPQNVIDAVNTLPDVFTSPISQVGGVDDDLFNNYFDPRMNGFNTNGFTMSYKVWYLVESV